MRKILTIILAIALLISNLAAVSSARGELSSTDAVNVVKALGVFDGISQNAADDSEVSRGEFAEIVSKLINTQWNESGESPFYDVETSNVYFNQICMMNKMGIMVGDSTGAFHPQQSITYAQAVKCMVYLLGYTNQAEKMGGYPVGYYMQASKLDITDNISYQENKAINRRDLAQIIYNSLDVQLLDLVAVGKKLTYSSEENDNILSRYLGVRKFEGILNAVDGRSILTREEVCDEGFVKIGSTVAKYSDETVAQYLGFRMEAYVTDEEVPTLICAYPTDDNEELMIKIGDLDTEHSEFSLTQFRYLTRDGRTQKAELTQEHRFVYNGMYDLDFDLDDLGFETGYVTLINNDNDSEYDVCMIWDYENYVFESGKEDIIKCFYNKSLRYDEDVTYRVLTADGIWGGWEQLANLSSWDVLSAAKSKDGSLITIYANRGGIAGTVNGLSDDEGKTIVTIDGKEYTVSQQYLNSAPNSGTVVIKAGLKSEFFFDVIGEIAAVYKTSGVEDAYGYILGAEPESNLSTRYDVKIFTQKGKIEYYKADSKIKFTGKIGASLIDGKSTEAADVFNSFVANAEFVPDVILYSANDEGVIKSIKKSVDATALGYDIDHFSEDFSVGTIAGDTQTAHYRYQDATSTFGMGEKYEKRFNVNGSTIIMYAPTSGGELVEEDMVIADIAMFTSGTLYENFKIYDCDDTYNAGLMLYTPEASGEGGNVKEEYCIAIEKVYTGLNDDEEFEDMVRVMYRGSEKVMPYIAEDGYIPEKGSILRCEKKLTGELVLKRENLIYSPSSTTAFFDMKTLDSGGSTYLPLVWGQYGRIWRKNGAAFTVYTGTDTPCANYLDAGCMIYKIDKDFDITVAGEGDMITSSASVADGSLVVINNRYQYVREMWIIEE